MTTKHGSNEYINGKYPRNRRNAGRKHSASDAENELKKQSAVISRKKEALVSALKAPPAVHQFNQKMDEELKGKIEEIFLKYKPETPEERAARIEKKEEKKQVSIRFGIREVVSIIEKKRAKLVLIANNVDPLVVVLFLPALCKKMGVSYAVFDTKERLGAMVGRKTAACVAIEEVVPGLKGLISEVDEQFSSRYSEIMSTWGSRKRDQLKNETK